MAPLKLFYYTNQPDAESIRKNGYIPVRDGCCFSSDRVYFQGLGPRTEINRLHEQNIVCQQHSCKQITRYFQFFSKDLHKRYGLKKAKIYNRNLWYVDGAVALSLSINRKDLAL